MRRVKCLYKNDVLFVTITPYKVYDVISLGVVSNTIVINNDFDVVQEYSTEMFKDITAEWRNDVIDGVLQ